MECKECYSNKNRITPFLCARECLENGDLEETEKVLDLKEISEDINNNHNLNDKINRFHNHMI